MKKSDKNLDVINNFILHVTHSSDNTDKTPVELTVEDLYQMAEDYIAEDHVDGKENPTDTIVTYGAESSYQHEDKDKEYPEHIVVVADFGDDVGTCTCATFDGITNLEAVNDFLEYIKNPQL
jgi:hypothetical protein